MIKTLVVFLLIAGFSVGVALAQAPGPITFLGVASTTHGVVTPAAPTLGPWEAVNAANESLYDIVTAIDKAVGDLDEGTVRRMLIERYRTLRLMDSREEWRVPELEEHAGELLPPHMNGVRLSVCASVMADVASRNPYVMRFLKEAYHHRFPRLAERVAAEGKEVFPRVMVHAFVLERLTGLMVRDHRISAACRAHWQRVVDTDARFWRAQSWFAQLKTRSVNLGIDAFNRAHAAGQADRTALAFTLPFNIMEATCAQLGLALIDGPARAGHLANAAAGVELITHGPQGAGPSHFSADGQLVEIHPLAEKSWDDLYATWNMAFITVVGTWPYFLAKLVIPSVNDYARTPGTYMNRRALALEIQMYVNGLDLADGTLIPIDWRDPELTRVFGLVNRTNAVDYAARARASAP